jgi:hypothetical protein
MGACACEARARVSDFTQIGNGVLHHESRLKSKIGVADT